MAYSKELESGSPTGGPPPTDNTNVNANDFAQAYNEIARGEQAAAELEANLSKLENKLDELLAGVADPESIRAQLAALDTEGQQPAGPDQETNTENTKEEGNGVSKVADARAGKGT
ncbi:hypothetical protein ACRALDRAFT_1063680 [Sodiomyces alcalophilus JCM 7366]|uniref:uncharacterized protein n=1 Tax=Sodiomyces alcalophilus JCM 7366 TaxID=591952 RepID=UPI0039B392E9